MKSIRRIFPYLYVAGGGEGCRSWMWCSVQDSITLAIPSVLSCPMVSFASIDSNISCPSAWSLFTSTTMSWMNCFRTLGFAIPFDSSRECSWSKNPYPPVVCRRGLRHAVITAKRCPRFPWKLSPDHRPRPDGSTIGLPMLRVTHFPVVAVNVSPGWYPLRRAEDLVVADYSNTSFVPF